MDLTEIDNDFNEEEVEKINKYVSNGCIGLQPVVADDHKVNSMFGLYMAGKNYLEISKITRVKKDIVLYMSAKMRWYEKRIDYLDSLQSNITEKIKNTQIQSLNFIADLIAFHHKFYGEQIDEYMRTGDKTIVANLDMKQLSQYFKSIEILEKILNPANVQRGKGSSATININAAGAEIKADEDTIEIKPTSHGDILRQLAEEKAKKKSEE